MGTIVEFPAECLRRRPAAIAGGFHAAAPATVTILPVVRIERHGEPTPRDAPHGRARPSRRRKRPAQS